MDAALFAAAVEAYVGRGRSGFDLHRLAWWQGAMQSADYLSRHMMKAAVYSSRKRLHLAMLAMAPTDGLVLEFGVAGGKSIRRTAAATSRPVYGFDSFEGLPETWLPEYQAGHFAQPMPQVQPHVTLIKGWFSDTVAPFMARTPGDVAFVHIDCDLGSATRTVFEAIEDRIKPGCVILFDEYFNYPGWQDHEHAAFMEMIERTGLDFEYVGVARSNKQVGVVIR